MGVAELVRVSVAAQASRGIGLGFRVRFRRTGGGHVESTGKCSGLERGDIGDKVSFTIGGGGEWRFFSGFRCRHRPVAAGECDPQLSGSGADDRVPRVPGM